MGSESGHLRVAASRAIQASCYGETLPDAGSGMMYVPWVYSIKLLASDGWGLNSPRRS